MSRQTDLVSQHEIKMIVEQAERTGKIEPELAASRSVDELMREKESCDLDLRRMKVALGETRAKAYVNRDFANPAWYRQMEMAELTLRFNSQALQRAMSVRKMMVRSTRRTSYEAAFVEAARTELDAYTFNIIHSDAMDAVADVDPSIRK